MVVLYNPVSSAGRKPILPLALLALGAVLEGKHDYVVVDGNLAKDALAELDAAVTEAVSHFREGRTRLPPVLGITAMPGPQLVDAVPLVRELRRRHPNLITVWGGYFATQHADVCLSSLLVDFVVRGHGELVFLELLSALAEGPTPERLRDIAGLSWHDASGLVHNPMAPVPRPADLPDFPLHRVDVQRYLRPSVLGQRTIGYHSSYGCPFPCNFCAVVTMVNGKWAPQPAERVAAAVERFVSMGADAVEMYDNNFFVHEGRCREFSDRIAPLGISWWGEGRIDTLLRWSDETWASMARSGLRMVFMGAESGSAETLARMEKGGTLTPEMTLELVDRMGRFGVVPELSFVLGSPPEPEKDIEQTLDFVRRVKEKNPRTEIVLYLYTPEPVDGELWERAKASGFSWPSTLDEWADPAWSDVVQRRSRSLPWLDDRVRQRVHDFERVLNAWYPTSTDPRLRDGPWRLVLRAAAGWRWKTGIYARPYELRALQKVLRYQRPETSGF
jgi:anaerobic magnesium-protoporphyrin IX monomethyl ester cyclase